ncbi:MAG: PRC-barrel domain-containing protein [Ferruginibacter sp.]
MEAENKRKTRLQKLSGSDFEIADGQPDIRGWEVMDSSGKQMGEVDELIFDYQSRKVRYLVVNLDNNEFDMDDKDVLVPIGIAELHENNDEVILPGVMPDQLRALPEYDEDRFDTEHESNVRNIFGGLGASTATGSSDDDEFYNHDHFNEANLYRKRMNTVDNNITGTLLPGETEGGMPSVNPGGVWLRSREKNREGSTEIRPGNPPSKDQDADQNEYPIL